MRDTRDNVLKAGCRSFAAINRQSSAQFVNRKFHPKLGRLMLDDKQHLVMGAG
mgnify:CR=1 FL=1